MVRSASGWVSSSMAGRGRWIIGHLVILHSKSQGSTDLTRGLTGVVFAAKEVRELRELRKLRGDGFASCWLGKTEK